MTAAEKRWQVHVAGWKRSGLSCKAYAAQVGVHPGTLAAWKSYASGQPRRDLYAEPRYSGGA